MTHASPTIAYLKANGIPVINVPNRLLNTAIIAILRGTFHDPIRLEGAHHAIEHLVSGKSDTFTGEQLVLMMERLFGGTNGEDVKIYTVEMLTAYGFRDMPDRKAFHEAFMLFGSLVRDAVRECHNTHRKDGRQFELGGLLCERAAVHNEVRMRRDDIPLSVIEAVPRLLWEHTQNPARFTGTGNLKQFRQMESYGSLKHIASGSYVPENMVVVAVGPTQNELLEYCAEAELDTLKPYKSAPLLYDGSDADPRLTTILLRTIWRPGIQQVHVGLGWPTETFMSEDGPALEILARILKMRVELFLRDQNTQFDGGVYHPSSEWDATAWHGFLDIWFATAGDAMYADWATDHVLRICNELKNEKSPALDNQIRAATSNMASILAQQWRWFPDLLAERICDFFANGDRELTHLLWYEDRIAHVTAKDVRAVANKYLHVDRFVRVVARPLYVPTEIYERATEESKPFLAALLQPTD